MLRKLRPHHALTPHPGEAERLLGRALADPASDARALAAFGCAAILKGASRLIAVHGGRSPVLSATGCAGMAKGGSGDVFAGMLGAHLQATRRRRSAAEDGRVDLALVAELHGLAGSSPSGGSAARA